MLGLGSVGLHHIKLRKKSDSYFKGSSTSGFKGAPDRCLVYKQVISTVLFFAVLGGGAYLWYRISENSKDGDGPDGSGGNEALTEAQRIMQKYK